LLLIACTVRCDGQQAGQAYRHGEFVTALQSWRELAAAGDDAAVYFSQTFPNNYPSP
jgi:hypothetical protein